MRFVVQNISSESDNLELYKYACMFTRVCFFILYIYVCLFVFSVFVVCVCVCVLGMLGPASSSGKTDNNQSHGQVKDGDMVTSS